MLNSEGLLGIEIIVGKIHQIWNKNHTTIDKHNGREKTKAIQTKAIGIIWFSKRNLVEKKKNHKLMTYRMPGNYFMIVLLGF